MNIRQAWSNLKFQFWVHPRVCTSSRVLITVIGKTCSDNGGKAADRPFKGKRTLASGVVIMVPCLATCIAQLSLSLSSDQACGRRNCEGMWGKKGKMIAGLERNYVVFLEQIYQCCRSKLHYFLLKNLSCVASLLVMGGPFQDRVLEIDNSFE